MQIMRIADRDIENKFTRVEQLHRNVVLGGCDTTRR
jgi:hypothetical protein